MGVLDVRGVQQCWGVRGCQGSEADGGPKLSEVRLPTVSVAFAHFQHRIRDDFPAFPTVLVVDLSSLHLKAKDLLHWLLVQLLPSWLCPKRNAQTHPLISSNHYPWIHDNVETRALSSQ